MAKIKLPVHLQNGSAHPEEHVVKLGAGFIRKLKVPVNQTVTLRFGSIRKEIKVVSTSKASIRLGESLGSRLGLHHGAQVTLSYNAGTRTLAMGPLIGVLIKRINQQSADRPFGSMTAFCKEMTDACALYGGFVYFFTPEDIASNASSVTAWTYSGRWTKRTFPSPDVVYNRLTSRRLENKPIVQHFMKEVKSRYGAVVFNEKYLNKTEVFQALRGTEALHGCLPESYLFKNYAMLKSMCRKHLIVFLKPTTGSLGKGIIKITRQREGAYLCSHTSLNGVRSKTYPSLVRLFGSISAKMKSRPYQIQQGLRLVEAGGRPIDFRALVQRNRQGQWSITSIVARTAANNTFVSNLARGGSLSTVSEALAKSNLPSSAKAGVHVRLRKAALDIAGGIESHIDAHFAELGIDLAVDTAGHVWLLEVNSKPSKDDNAPSGAGKIRPSVKQLLMYSQYASAK